MPSSATPNHTQSAAALAAEAAQLAMKAANLAELREAILSFDGCALKRSARQTVVHDGNPEGDILIIGEAPGAEEDKQGIPFCGASGQLLDQMLASINLSRSAQCLITNTVYWRPPGNRTPTVEELDICAPFVARHIGLFQPKLILLMGATAAKAVLNEQRSLSRLRNQPLSYACAQTNRDIPVRVLFHPSYLLRQPLHKKLAWQDLLAIEAMVKNN